MKVIVFILLFISKSIYCQSVVFMNIIRTTESDIVGSLEVYKQINDSTYDMREKLFRNQSMVSIDPGFYVFRYKFNDKIFTERLLIYDNESVVLINIPEDEVTLKDFDFSNAIYVTLGMAKLALKNRQDYYIEF